MISQNDKDFFIQLRKPIGAVQNIALPSFFTHLKSYLIFFVPVCLFLIFIIAFLLPHHYKSFFHPHKAHKIFNKLDLSVEEQKNLLKTENMDITDIKDQDSYQALQKILNKSDDAIVQKALGKLDEYLFQAETILIRLEPTIADIPELQKAEIRYYDLVAESAHLQQDYDQSLDYAHKALEKSIQYFGDQSLITAKHYELAGFFHDKMNQKDQAMAYQHNAIMVYQSIPQYDIASLLIKMNNLAETYRKAKKYDHAYKMVSDTLLMVEKQYSTAAPEIVIPLNNLGLIKLSMGERTKAETYLRRAYELSYKHQGASHSVTKLIASNLKKIY